MNKSDAILVLLCIVVDTVLVWWGVREHKRKKHKNDIYFINMCNSIHELNERANQAEELDRMIQDIESCSKNLLKSIRIELPESLSNKKSGTAFLIDGKDQNSKYLLSIAYSERDRLRSSLQNDLANVLRSGVSKTVRKTDENINEYDRGVQNG